MTQFQSGADALNALNATNEGNGGSKAEFAKFSSGTSYKVRVLGTADLIRFYSFGVFKKVNSFVAKNPAKRNPRGYAVEDLGPWDKAAKYYQDLAFAARDKGDAKAEEDNRNQAYQYRAKERYALGFIDLATGDPIIVDLSKKQAQSIHAVITKFEKKLGKVAFELSKQGSGQSTTVSLTPFIDMDDDLDDKERANFAKLADATFDMALFDGLLYEADEKEQIENLVAAGFDISLIGLSVGGEKQAEDNGGPGEVYEF
jgi:hypothetical protein